MSFMTYSLNFYTNELNELENGIATNKKIYRAKQLLKMLDDLVDEGYTELYETLEQTINGVSRLKKYLDANDEKPFTLCVKSISHHKIVYGQEKLELLDAIETVYKRALATTNISNDAFIQRLRDFCDWLGYKDDTAYVFLLRDTLLPYIFYRSKSRENIFPWLISRQSLSFLSGKEFVDDELRSSIINVLEGYSPQSFAQFADIVLPDMKKTLRKYPKLEKSLTELICGIKQKHIMVIELGSSGTFPLLLMSIDSRIDIRMYTTYPYLMDIYGDKVFTEKYEEARLFETMYSQDLYFRFADWQNEKFFVNKCDNSDVEERTLAEIKTMIQD